MPNVLEILAEAADNHQLGAMQGERCVYSDGEGKHCAIGFLMSDEDKVRALTSEWNSNAGARLFFEGEHPHGQSYGRCTEELQSIGKYLEEKYDLNADTAKGLQVIHDRCFDHAAPAQDYDSDCETFARIMRRIDLTMFPSDDFEMGRFAEAQIAAVAE